MPALKEGKAAPEFSLPSTEGREIRLSDYRGKTNVVIYFYPKDNTPGCTKESCDFRDSQAQFKKRNAVILGVSADSLKSHGKFQESFKLPFPLLSDEDKGMIKKYGVWKEKSLYGKTYMGIERTTVIIDREGKVRRIFPKVKVDGHVAEVIETLDKIKS